MENVCSINNLAACLVQSGMNPDLANLLTTLGGVVLIATVPLVTVIFLIWIERKVAARVQDRIGPNRVGPFGLLQSVADAVKMITKFVGILPLTRYFRFERKEGMYTTLMMSTGLTFGSISALYGLTNHIIDERQYTILLTAVIGSAVVPTLIAQRWFQPAFKPLAAENPTNVPAVADGK